MRFFGRFWWCPNVKHIETPQLAKSGSDTDTASNRITGCRTYRGQGCKYTWVPLNCTWVKLQNLHRRWKSRHVPAKHETKFLDHVDGPFPDLIWVRIKPWRRRHKESVHSAQMIWGRGKWGSRLPCSVLSWNLTSTWWELLFGEDSPHILTFHFDG